MNRHFWARVAQSWKPLALVLCAAACVATAYSWIGQIPPELRRPIIVGIDNAPPYHLALPDGTITGMVVEVLQSAARKRGIELRFVDSVQGPDISLETRQVDIWPLLTVTPERSAKFHLTESWLRHSHSLVSLSSSHINRPEDTAGRVVAQWIARANSSLAHKALPDAILDGLPSRERVIDAVCRGEAPAGFIESRYLDSILLDRPSTCLGASLRIIPLSNADAQMAIASTEQAGPIADELRKGISELAANGSLLRIMDKWSAFSSREARSVFELQEVEHRARLAWTGLTISTFAAALLLWQIQRARRASAVKGDFLANMSHEIRTPMNGIIGMTDLALESENPKQQTEYLQIVKSSAQSLLTIINDILDCAKVEAGKLTIECIPFALRESVEDTVKVLRFRAAEKGLPLRVLFGPGVPEYVAGDPGRLRQILVNLVGNAIKFTHAGEIAVNVSCDENPSYLRFEVRDTGIGIPQKKQRTIFQPFSQADTSTTRKYGGTGLGLTISVRLVALMQGQMWVDSQEGKGSSFHFRIRLEPSNAPLEQKHASTAGAQARGRILLIEDNDASRRIITAALQRSGFDALAVSSGTEAIQRLEQSTDRPFDLLLIDICMPDMDGFTVSEKILSMPHLKQNRIVLLTSAGQRGDVARCRELGIEGYVTKSPDAGDIVQGVRQVLEGRVPAGEVLTRHTLEQPPGRRLHVLLAEDNAVNQKLATRILERSGHTVSVAANGFDVLAACKTEKFDVILMDVQMPGIDGIEATRCVRAAERSGGGHVPIIALTAHALKGDRMRCLAAGMDAYVSKPIDAKELLRTLDVVTAPRSSAAYAG